MYTRRRTRDRYRRRRRTDWGLRGPTSRVARGCAAGTWGDGENSEESRMGDVGKGIKQPRRQNGEIYSDAPQTPVLTRAIHFFRSRLFAPAKGNPPARRGRVSNDSPARRHLTSCVPTPRSCIHRYRCRGVLFSPRACASRDASSRAGSGQLTRKSSTRALEALHSSTNLHTLQNWCRFEKSAFPQDCEFSAKLL